MELLYGTHIKSCLWIILLKILNSLLLADPKLIWNKKSGSNKQEKETFDIFTVLKDARYE